MKIIFPAFGVNMKHEFKRQIVSIAVCSKCRKEVTEICSLCKRSLCEPCHSFEKELKKAKQK